MMDIVDRLAPVGLVLILVVPVTVGIADNWGRLDPAERARIKRRAPGIAARGILGALKWSLVAAAVFLVELVRFALKENPDPHNRKL